MPANPAVTAITEPVYLRSSEVASLLRCTPWTITARCRAGVYAGAKQYGRYWLIPTSVIKALLPQDATEAQAA